MFMAKIAYSFISETSGKRSNLKKLEIILRIPPYNLDYIPASMILPPKYSLTVAEKKTNFETIA